MSIIKYQKGTSYWMEDFLDAKYPKLKGDIETDVVIIGAGIAGLSAAYLLKQSGLKVAVLEKHTIGSGTTGHTTGKVTSQHGLVYADLQKRFGKKKVRAYGEANQAGLEQIKKIIEKEKIDCDWRNEDNYVFTEKTDQVARFKHEAEIAKSLGLPANFQTETPLPFPVKAAVRFNGQGTFHSRKYLLGLAKSISGDGSQVFEHTKAETIHDGNPATVKTKSGSVHAKHLIIATLVPYTLTSHTAYGLVEYPLKSYIVATRADIDLPGMYITPDDPAFSILPVLSDEKLLLIGGQSHIPGLGSEKKHYESLIHYAKERFNATPTKYRWSAWDYLSYDRIPVIGKLYPWSRNVYSATGFMKWGLTTGTAAGMILRDLITEKENRWADTFDSTRLSTVASIPRFIARLPKLVG
jgi:glycine/D-amino acid oxidase-like deaminating enzyme